METQRQISVHITHPITPLTDVNIQSVCRELPAGILLEYIRLYEAVYNRTVTVIPFEEPRAQLTIANWPEMRTLILGLDDSVTWLNLNLPEPESSSESFDWHFRHFRVFPLSELVDATEPLPFVTRRIAHELLYGIATALLWKAEDDTRSSLVYLECCGRNYRCF